MIDRLISLYFEKHADKGNKLLEKLQNIRIYEEDIMSVAQKIEQQGLQRGLQQGRHEGELSLAKKMLNQGIGLDLIKSAGGFSEQELIELEKA